MLSRRFITGDVFYKIVEFLDPADVISACRAFGPKKNLFDKYLESVPRVIDRRFRDHFGDHFPKFRAIMSENKTGVSGSFVLQKILGVKWPNSDIDFYQDDRTNKCDFRSFLEEFCGEHPLLSQVSYPHNDILCVETFPSKSEFHQFQLITISENHFQDLWKRIQGMFDLNVCTNMFYYDVSGNPRVHIGFIRDILTKKTKLSGKVPPDEGRILKYEARGFTIENTSDFFDEEVIEEP